MINPNLFQQFVLLSPDIAGEVNSCSRTDFPITESTLIVLIEQKHFST